MGELEEIGRVVGRLGMVFFIHMREYPKVCVNLQTDVR